MPIQALAPTEVLGPGFISLPIALSVILLAIAFLPPAVMRQARVIFVAMAVLAFVGFYVSVAALRAYYRSAKLLETELANFTVKESLCWCCDTLTDHTCEGEEIICDRQVVLRCIVTWFGTVERFEERVRTEVLDCTPSAYNGTFCVHLVLGLSKRRRDQNSANML